MKTKTLFCLCLFLGIGLTQLSAQNGKDGTGSVVYYIEHADFYTDIWCNGVFVDWIVGEGTAHIVDHYKNNVLSNGKIVLIAVQQQGFRVILLYASVIDNPIFLLSRCNKISILGIYVNGTFANNYLQHLNS